MDRLALDEACTLEILVCDSQGLGFGLWEDKHHLHARDFKDTAGVEFEFLAFADCEIVDFNAIAAVNENHPARGIAVEEDLGM